MINIRLLSSAKKFQVLKIAQNSANLLNSGYFAVKNRSPTELKNGVTLEQRHENEKTFFATAPWNNLTEDRVGIQPLKKFLGNLLYNHICEELPALVQDIRNLVLQLRKKLDALGPPHQTTVQ